MLVGKSIRHPISAGFTYLLQKRGGSELAGMPTPTHLGRIYLLRQRGGCVSQRQLLSISAGFTYELRQRRSAVLAGNSASRHRIQSQHDSLTIFGSEGR